jgi:hypothetical protein
VEQVLDGIACIVGVSPGAARSAVARTESRCFGWGSAGAGRRSVMPIGRRGCIRQLRDCGRTGSRHRQLGCRRRGGACRPSAPRGRRSGRSGRRSCGAAKVERARCSSAAEVAADGAWAS